MCSVKIADPSGGGGGAGGWQRGLLEPSLHDRPSLKFGRVRLSTIFLQNKYGGECRRGRTMSLCSVLSFPTFKHQEKVFKNIFNGFLDIRRRGV